MERLVGDGARDIPDGDTDDRGHDEEGDEPEIAPHPAVDRAPARRRRLVDGTRVRRERRRDMPRAPVGGVLPVGHGELGARIARHGCLRTPCGMGLLRPQRAGRAGVDGSAAAAPLRGAAGPSRVAHQDVASSP